jgi:hypothetical protein
MPNMVEVVATDEFVEWYEELERVDLRIVDRLVDLLEAGGLALGTPHSSAIRGASFALRELRGQGKPIRVFYAFDPRREAVLLIGGDKTGDDRFYERMIRECERIWKEYLAELEGGEFK